MAKTIRDSILLPKALRHLLIVHRRDEIRVEHYVRPRLSTNFGEPVGSYKAAVGAIGFQTPKGVFVISRKSDNPDWLIPSSKWVSASYRERWAPTFVIPAGHPENPIREAFLDIWEGVGIHGTQDFASLGTSASHGCIRVAPEHAQELYEQVPTGTPVVIT